MLTSKTGPKNGIQIIQEALAKIPGALPTIGKVKEHSTESWQIAAPQEIFDLSLEYSEEEHPLETARSVGWRYLILRPDGEAEAIVELVPESGGKWRFANFAKGPAVSNYLASIARIESLKFVKSYDFELRYLQIPSLYVSSLWLKSSTNDGDRFLIVPPTFPPAESNTPYEESQFIAVVQELKRRRTTVSEGSTTLGNQKKRAETSPEDNEGWEVAIRTTRLLRERLESTEEGKSYWQEQFAKVAAKMVSANSTSSSEMSHEEKKGKSFRPVSLWKYTSQKIREEFLPGSSIVGAWLEDELQKV